jgi:pimeloyl-ACP methyl ester carboxylesterase
VTDERAHVEVPSSDGVTIALHDFGGDGEPFLLCHATGFLGRAYAPLAAELEPSFHVWALDFRGHGDSTAPADDRFDWSVFTDDLLSVIDALGTEPIHAFGHSLGGGVLMLAEQRRRGSLRSAFLFEPIVIPALEGVLPAGPSSMGDAARRRRSVFPTKAEALHRYASRPPLNELRADALYAYVEHGFRTLPDGSAQLKCRPEHEAATFEASGKPTLETVADIDTPVTVAIGTTTQGWTPADFGEQVADALPNGHLERHPSLGHFGPLQDPVAIAESIVAATHG